MAHLSLSSFRERKKGVLTHYPQILQCMLLSSKTRGYITITIHSSQSGNKHWYNEVKWSEVKVIQLCPTLCDSMNYTGHGILQPTSHPSIHGDSPGKTPGVGSHSLLQGIFPTQGSNPGLLHCRQILCQLSHLGNPVDTILPSNSIHGLTLKKSGKYKLVIVIKLHLTLGQVNTQEIIVTLLAFLLWMCGLVLVDKQWMESACRKEDLCS